MSAETAEAIQQQVSHQFEDIDQQNESYIVGMWTFLVTEIMFFGALFTCYFLFRYSYPTVFATVSREHLDWRLGGLNTLILLTSSLSMALAVRHSQLGQRAGALRCLAFTLFCAFGFLIVKAIEYSAKYHDHLIPGPFFHWTDVPGAPAIPPGKAELFVGIYFAMTGLHGIHVVVGILCIATLMGLIATKSKVVQDYMPVELVGLYWHFVDIVWIFLYPLLYLIDPKF
jgi:cytochrome c oxidase subunit 3